MAFVFAHEGSRLDLTPSDRGNWTGGRVGAGLLRGSRRGISAAAYPTLDIAGLTDGQIAAIYRVDYWRRIAGDDLPPPVALVVGDGAVNQGVGAASRDLQDAVGVPADGVVGPVTVAAVRRKGNQLDDLAVELVARRAVRYARADTFPIFGLGWSRRLAAAARAAFRA
nr:glycosyl hydrolase 108 family protein [Limobrevibacterium gyesilva]